MGTLLINSARYAKCLHNAQKVNWNIDTDVIRFRQLDTSHKFLPDSLSLVHELPFLTPSQQRLLSQVQGRTYANLFGVIERYINAKVLQLTQDHALGDQTALAALLQFSQEEMKHQELFRRTERLAAAAMPAGHVVTADANAVAALVLGKSGWAVMALTCLIELFTQAHYVHAIRDDANLSPLFKDIFHYHWLEESQHAILDDLEWQRTHDAMTPEAIDAGVDDLISLVGAFDQLVQAQALADRDYFCNVTDGDFTAAQRKAIGECIIRAYQLQYIVSGAQIDRFQQALMNKTTVAQMLRIQAALEPLVKAVNH